KCLIMSRSSTSLRRYERCPVPDFFGARLGNSVSQWRRTYGSTASKPATSPILKYNLSGISGVSLVTSGSVISLPSYYPTAPGLSRWGNAGRVVRYAIGGLASASASWALSLDQRLEQRTHNVLVQDSGPRVFSDLRRHA